jgi:hypothetical protein
MSIVETAMVFVGIPALVIAVIAGLVYLSSARPSRRYRPGRPFEFTPVWFLSSPDDDVAGEGRPVIEVGSSGPPAQTATREKGGARGRW